MIKTLLTVLAASGMLRFIAQAQTTPAGTAQPISPTSKTGQGNASNTAPNRSSTAGSPKAKSSDNPVDATGKPVSTTPSNSANSVKARKPKK